MKRRAGPSSLTPRSREGPFCGPGFGPAGGRSVIGHVSMKRTSSRRPSSWRRSRTIRRCWTAKFPITSRDRSEPRYRTGLCGAATCVMACERDLKGVVGSGRRASLHRRPGDVVADDQKSGLHTHARSARVVRVTPGRGPATPGAAAAGSRIALRTAAHRPSLTRRPADAERRARCADQSAIGSGIIRHGAGTPLARRESPESSKERSWLLVSVRVLSGTCPP